VKRAIPVLVLVLVFLLVATEVAAAAPMEWSILGYHVVRPGETLYCIARAYGVSPWAIANQNGILSPNYIYPGMTLAIPNAYASLPPGPVCPAQFGGWPDPCMCIAYHTVAYGDTLTRISLWYGVNMWTIAECNGIYNLNYIRAGSVLCIPDP
jgi:spore germination protein